VLVAAGIVLVVVLARGRDGGEPAEKPPSGGERPKPVDGGLGIVVPPPAAPLLPRAKVQKLQMGMKPAEVAALFGPGRAVTEQLVRDTYRAMTQTDGASWFARARAAGARSWERWANGGDVLCVAYGPTKRGDRVVTHICFYDGPAGGTMDPGRVVLPGELESAAERWDRETGVLSDPKWKTGKEARAALLGRWQIQTGGAGYEFRPDGTYQWLGIGSYTSTYRFSDHQALELDTFDPYAKLKGPTIPYRVLVAGDEMYLVHEPDATRPLPVGPYIRQKAEKK